MCRCSHARALRALAIEVHFWSSFSKVTLSPWPSLVLYHILGHYARKKRLSGDWKSALSLRTSCARYKYIFEVFGPTQVLFLSILEIMSLMRKKSWFLRVQTSQRIAIANISRRKRPAWCTNRAVGPPWNGENHSVHLFFGEKQRFCLKIRSFAEKKEFLRSFWRKKRLLSLANQRCGTPCHEIYA